MPSSTKPDISLAATVALLTEGVSVAIILALALLVHALGAGA